MRCIQIECIFQQIFAVLLNFTIYSKAYLLLYLENNELTVHYFSFKTANFKTFTFKNKLLTFIITQGSDKYFQRFIFVSFSVTQPLNQIKYFQLAYFSPCHNFNYSRYLVYKTGLEVVPNPTKILKIRSKLFWQKSRDEQRFHVI